MSHCGTCKFWGNAGDTHRWRQCQAIIHDDRNLTESFNRVEEWDWLEEDQRQELIQVRDAAKAVCQDGSGYFAAVKCREAFGCVLYQPNPDAASAAG